MKKIWSQSVQPCVCELIMCSCAWGCLDFLNLYLPFITSSEWKNEKLKKYRKKLGFYSDRKANFDQTAKGVRLFLDIILRCFDNLSDVWNETPSHLYLKQYAVHQRRLKKNIKNSPRLWVYTVHFPYNVSKLCFSVPLWSKKKKKS